MEKEQDAKKIQSNVNWEEKTKEDLRTFPFIIQNQRDIPACVAHAIVYMMQVRWYEETGKIINLSPRFLDIISWTEDLNINDGRDGKLVMDLATEVGCCTEDLLPNDTTLPIEEYRDRKIITKEMYDEAAKYKLSNLGLVPVSVGSEDINHDSYLNDNMSKKTIRIRTLSLISSLLGIICGLISTYFFKNLLVNLLFLLLIGVSIKLLSKRKLALFFSEFFFLIFLTFTFNLFNFDGILNKIFTATTLLVFLGFIITIGLFFPELLSSLWYWIGEKVQFLKEKRVKNKLIKYSKKIDEIHKNTKHSINPQNNLNIDIKIRDQKLSKIIFDNIKQTKDLRIDLYDLGKKEREENKLNEKNKKILQSRGQLATGGPGEFFELSTYIIVFEVGKWVLRHILEDIDDAAWKSFKSFIKKIFTPFKDISKRDEEMVFVIDSKYEYKKIIFIFKKSMSIEQFENSFSKIGCTIKNIGQEKLVKNKEIPLVFDFNTKEEKWEIRNNINGFDVFNDE